MDVNPQVHTSVDPEQNTAQLTALPELALL